jgi:hypothetical protein
VAVWKGEGHVSAVVDDLVQQAEAGLEGGRQVVARGKVHGSDGRGPHRRGRGYRRGEEGVGSARRSTVDNLHDRAVTVDTVTPL